MREELFSLFKERAEMVSAEVHRVKDVQRAVEFIRNALSEIASEQPGETEALLLRGSLLEGVNPAELELPGAKVYDENFDRLAPGVMIGISQLDLAIADTGTLCQDATDVKKRLVSTLPSVHIALVPTGGLVANLAEALEKFQGQVPGYLAFITGPSRTADIERVLTIGVHGPERLIVLFIDEVGGGSLA